MANITSRQQLIDYCLRALGEPVVEINADDSQLEDRVDEALEFWRQYHWDGIEKIYLKASIRASEIRLTTNTAASFQLSEKVIGQTSGAIAEVCRETNRESNNNLLLVRNVVGTFQNGETIKGDATQHTAIVSSVSLGEYDKRYLELSDLIYGVTRVIPFNNASSSKNIFDLQYQLRLNDLYDLTSTSIIYYKTVMNHLALLDLELNGYPIFRFNRMQNKLSLDINWESDIALGDFIVVECYRALDPNEYTKVWGEPWLRHYVIALFKKQWGQNGKKFQGMVLPGGVSIDFQGMYNEAIEEIKQLEDELMNKSAPLEWFMG
jgi:hypothetical protein